MTATARDVTRSRERSHLNFVVYAVRAIMGKRDYILLCLHLSRSRGKLK